MMRISRREFAESGAVSVAGWYLLGPSSLGRSDTRAPAAGDCAVLDLGVDCGLRESLRGFQEALRTNPISVPEMRNWGQCSLVVVPGMAARTRDLTAMRVLLDLLEAGTSVLLESGAGFSREEEFAIHRKMLSDAFGIGMQSPLDVWRRAADGVAPQVARYVEYDWPCRTLVRDFSRVIPVLAAGADRIASAGSLSVAMKKRVRKGTLVFLGSPLGPGLLAGDLEAREWVRSLATAFV
jgi:hypothetical protein